MPSKEDVTMTEAAEELGISRQAVHQLLKSNRIIGAYQRGNFWFIPSPVRVIEGTRGPLPRYDTEAK